MSDTLQTAHVRIRGGDRPDGHTPRRRRRVPTTPTHYLVWVGALVVIVGPLVPIVVASFWSTPLYESGGRWTLDNYARLFADPGWWSAAGNSVCFATMTTVGAVLIGASVAVLVTRTDLPLARLVAGLLLVPVVLPGLVLIMGWAAAWAPFGFGSNWIATNTPFGVPFNLYSLFGMSVLCSTVTAPVVFFFARGVLVGMDSSLEDAARSTGASPLRALLAVTVPLLRPAILNSAMLVFALSLEVLGIALIVGSQSGSELIGGYLYANWVERVPADQGLVSAGGVCLLVVVSGLLMLRNRLTGDVRRFTTVTGKPGAGMRVRLGKARWPLAGVVAFGLLLAVVVPLATITLAAFVPLLSPFLNPLSQLTLDNFADVFGNASYVDSIVNSIVIAAVGGAVTTGVVAVLSVVAHRSTFRFRGNLQQTMLWPRATPGLIVGIGFFWSFAVLNPSGDVRATLWAIGIAFAVRNLALAYSAFYPAMAAIGLDMERAARTSGASWWRAATSIVLRLVTPAMAVSFVLLFVAMLNDYDPAVFLVTPDTPVMGLTMLQISLTGVAGPVAAFGVLQMAITLAVLGLGRLLWGVRARV